MELVVLEARRSDRVELACPGPALRDVLIGPHYRRESIAVTVVLPHAWQGAEAVV